MRGGCTTTCSANLPPPIGCSSGASCAFLVLHARRFHNHLLSWLLAACTLAIDAFIGATPFVDNSGNTAGFVSGLLVAGGVLCLRLVGMPSCRTALVACGDIQSGDRKSGEQHIAESPELIMITLQLSVVSHHPAPPSHSSRQNDGAMQRRSQCWGRQP